MRHPRQRGTEPIYLPVTSSTALPNLLSSGVNHPLCDILIKLKTIPFNCIWAAKERQEKTKESFPFADI